MPKTAAGASARRPIEQHASDVVAQALERKGRQIRRRTCLGQGPLRNNQCTTPKKPIFCLLGPILAKETPAPLTKLRLENFTLKRMLFHCDLLCLPASPKPQKIKSHSKVGHKWFFFFPGNSESRSESRSKVGDLKVSTSTVAALFSRMALTGQRIAMVDMVLLVFSSMSISTVGVDGARVSV